MNVPMCQDSEAMDTPARLRDLTSTDVRASQGIDFARSLSAMFTARKHKTLPAPDIFAARWPTSPYARVIKSAVEAGGTPDGWGQGLVPTALSQQFVAFQHPSTILAKLGDVRRVPFYTWVTRSTQAMPFTWVGPGRAKPVTAGAFDAFVLPVAKAGGIIMVTDELLKLTSPQAEQFLRDEMRRGLTAWLDRALIDPAIAAVSGESPGSITSTAPSVVSSGPSATDALVDIEQLLATYLSVGGSIDTAVFILSSANAAALNLSGLQSFRDLRRDGGTLAGLPALMSGAAGTNLILVDTNALIVADEGVVEVDLGLETSLVMSDAPNSETGEVKSAYQCNMIAIRAERLINWYANGGVAYVSDASYLPEAPGSPA